MVSHKRTLYNIYNQVDRYTSDCVVSQITNRCYSFETCQQDKGRDDKWPKKLIRSKQGYIRFPS